MKIFKFFWCLILAVSVLFFSSCSEDTPLYRAKIIDASNRPPVADYTTEYAVNYPHTDINLISKSSDPEGRIVEYGWIINGIAYSGKTVTLSFEQPGTYQVFHFVRDEDSRAEKTGALRVSEHPRILVRLQYINFSNNVGDGNNEIGEVYLVVHGVTTNRSSPQPPPRQVIFPDSPDKVKPWSMAPNSRNSFGPNSGLILFDGKVTDLFGFSVVAIDHDERGFDWTGFFSKIFDAAATIVAPFQPIAGTVLEGLGKISGIVGEFIKEPQDDVIAHFEKLHQPKIPNRWGIGQTFESSNNGVTIGYSVEAVP